MVAVQMRDKDGPEPGEADVRTAQLHLCALATVDHKKFPPHLYHLRGGIVAEGGQGTSAT